MRLLYCCRLHSYLLSLRDASSAIQRGEEKRRRFRLDVRNTDTLRGIGSDRIPFTSLRFSFSFSFSFTFLFDCFTSKCLNALARRGEARRGVGYFVEYFSCSCVSLASSVALTLCTKCRDQSQSDTSVVSKGQCCRTFDSTGDETKANEIRHNWDQSGAVQLK